MAKKKDNEQKGIVAYINEYGIDQARKMISKSPVKYRETLDALNKSGDFKVIDVIDNQATPDKSQSHFCQVKSCGRRIRYEFIIENNDHERLVCGSSCIKTLTNFEDWKITELIKIPSELKLKHEHDQKYNDWLSSVIFINGSEVQVTRLLTKLEKLAKTGIPIFELLHETAAVHHNILLEDDIRFIWFTNVDQAFTNARILKKVETLLERAIKYNNDKGLIKRMSIYKDRLSTNAALSKEQEEYVTNYRYEDRPYGSCPCCAGKLVKRTSIYGQFIGCENYKLLKCEYTKNI